MQRDFRRKQIRLPAENYVGRKLYFVTLCFEDRRPFGSDAQVAAWLIERLRKHAAASRFFVHAYCVMRDHVHFLADGGSDESSLTEFVHAFKEETGFEFSQRTHQKLWQFKYYDRILRGTDAPERVAWYIWMNPVRKEICETPGEYPFLGSFTEVGARIFYGARAPEWVPPWKKA